MLSEQTDKLMSNLLSLGLSSEESKIYLYLAEKGPSTVLAVSKYLHISRTKVYRLLDTLSNKMLVVQRVGDRGAKFEIQPLSNLKLLVIEKENELNTIKNTFIPLITELESFSKQNGSDSKVLYYKGLEGLKQVTWNSLKAKGAIRIFEIAASMNAFVDQKFAEKVRKELVDRKIKIRQLTNLKQIPEHTQVTDLVKKFWELRYVDAKKFKIRCEMVIYNDVVAVYTYKDKEIFCVELYNPDLADMQKELFDFVWKSSASMKKIGEKGEAVIKM